MSKIHDIAKDYIERGWAVIPVEPRGKIPDSKKLNWKSEQLSCEGIQKLSAVDNLGIALGTRSGGLTDIDNDIPEAAIMAQKMLPELPSFGRKSSPYSHRLAICPDAENTKQFKLTKDEAEIVGLTAEGDKTVVIELRANGGQTVFPGSTHSSGEAVEWQSGTPNNIPVIEWNRLLKTVSHCAVLSIILKMYPKAQGSRNSICLALAGALLTAGYAPDEADDLIVFIAEQKGDSEAQSRRNAHATLAKMETGEPTTGLPALCELLGISALGDKLAKWLYGAQLASEDVCEKEVLELNKRFFAVRNEGSKCLIGCFESQPLGKGIFRDMLVFQSPGDWKSWFANYQVITEYKDGVPIFKSIGKIWWEHPKRRQYERVVFMPEQEVPDDFLNLWRGYGIKPIKGSWRRMQRHIWRVLAKRDPQAFRYIIKWCAWAVQNPAEPAEVAIVFRGGKGTGKGTFCNSLVTIFGHHGLAISSSMHLTGRFNAHMRDCVLLFADEAIAPNDKKAESIMKALITEPRLMIEGKNKDPIPHLNHLHIVMASNDSWVVPASADERRYAVFEVSDTVAQSENWFAPLYHELSHGGLNAMLYFFKNLDLKGWHPRKNIPINDALREQQAQSLSGVDRVWFDWLCTAEAQGLGHADGCVFIPTSLFAKITGTSLRAAALYLERMGCKKDRDNKYGRGYITPSLTDARKIWDQANFEGNWDSSDRWEPYEPDVPF